MPATSVPVLQIDDLQRRHGAGHCGSIANVTSTEGGVVRNPRTFSLICPPARTSCCDPNRLLSFAIFRSRDSARKGRGASGRRRRNPQPAGSAIQTGQQCLGKQCFVIGNCLCLGAGSGGKVDRPAALIRDGRAPIEHRARLRVQQLAEGCEKVSAGIDKVELGKRDIRVLVGRCHAGGDVFDVDGLVEKPTSARAVESFQEHDRVVLTALDAVPGEVEERHPVGMSGRILAPVFSCVQEIGHRAGLTVVEARLILALFRCGGDQETHGG